MSEKPEWFELSDEEPKPQSDGVNKKSKKRFVKIALFTAPLLLIGGAMVFAEGGNENDDVPAGVGTLSPATSTTDANSNSSNSSTLNGSTSSNSSTGSKSVKGVGVPKPSGGGEHEGGEGGGHEGGEGFGGEDD